MKNGLLLFLGAFVVLGLSWAGILLTSHDQLGALNQFKDPLDDTLYPQPMSGIADHGRLVYQDLGCVACHTQQVRREGFGGDIGRKWGERGGYARDYLRDKTVLLGQSRLGPDLRNVGKRIPDADYLYKLLYLPESKVGGTPLAHGMPAYRFLFSVHPVAGRQPAEHALQFTSLDGQPADLEVVPTPRAVELVAYLLSLQDTFDYPVEHGRNAPAEQPKEAAKPKEGAK